MPWGAQTAPNYGFAADLTGWGGSGTTTWIGSDGATAAGCAQWVVPMAAGGNVQSFFCAGTSYQQSLTGQSASWRGAAYVKLVSSTAGTIRAKISARLVDASYGFVADVILATITPTPGGGWVRVDGSTTVSALKTAYPTAAYVMTKVIGANDAGDGTAGSFTMLVDEIVGQFGDPSGVLLIEQPQGSRNRWPNPTFEADTVGTQPSGLTYYASGPGTSVVSQVVSSPTVEGTKSWRLAFTTPGTSQVTVGGTTQDFAVSPGEKLSVSMRGTMISTVTSPYNTVACAVQWKNAAGGVISTDYPSTSPAVGPFVANLTSTAPALAASANVRIYAQQAGPTFPYPAGTLDFVLDEVAVTTQPDTVARTLASVRQSAESIPTLDGGANEVRNPSAAVDGSNIGPEGLMQPTLTRVTGVWPDGATAVRSTRTSTGAGSIAAAWACSENAVPGVQYFATARVRNDSGIAKALTVVIYGKQANGTTDVTIGQATSPTLQPGAEATIVASGVASASAVGAMRVRVMWLASASGEDANWLTTDVHLVKSMAARSIVAARLPSELLSVVEEPTRTISAARPAAETLAPADAAMRALVALRAVAESIPLQDSSGPRIYPPAHIYPPAAAATITPGVVAAITADPPATIG